MNKNAIGITADLHMGRGGESGVKHQAKVFNEIIDGMIAARVSIAIFAGDIYNQYGWFTPDTFEILSDGFLKLRAAGIDVEIIPGNHDFDRSGLRSAVVPTGQNRGCPE